MKQGQGLPVYVCDLVSALGGVSLFWRALVQSKTSLGEVGWAAGLLASSPRGEAQGPGQLGLTLAFPQAQMALWRREGFS